MTPNLFANDAVEHAGFTVWLSSGLDAFVSAVLMIDNSEIMDMLNNTQ